MQKKQVYLSDFGHRRRTQVTITATNATGICNCVEYHAMTSLWCMWPKVIVFQILLNRNRSRALYESFLLDLVNTHTYHGNETTCIFILLSYLLGSNLDNLSMESHHICICDSWTRVFILGNEILNDKPSSCTEISAIEIKRLVI